MYGIYIPQRNRNHMYNAVKKASPTVSESTVKLRIPSSCGATQLAEVFMKLVLLCMEMSAFLHVLTSSVQLYRPSGGRTCGCLHGRGLTYRTGCLLSSSPLSSLDIKGITKSSSHLSILAALAMDDARCRAAFLACSFCMGVHVHTVIIFTAYKLIHTWY